MTQRNQHYEAAFEDFLRFRHVPFIKVDESKRTMFKKASLKSFDFMVYPEAGKSLLVDVKGRKFPELRPGKTTGAGAWENWVTQEDLSGLTNWQDILGLDSLGLFVFAYCVQGSVYNSPFDDMYRYKDQNYAFVAIEVDTYKSIAKVRSKKWQTYSAPVADFYKIAKPLEIYF